MMETPEEFGQRQIEWAKKSSRDPVKRLAIMKLFCAFREIIEGMPLPKCSTDETEEEDK